MRAPLSAAILAGFGREVESNEDVDLGLIELAQKNERLTRAQYLRLGTALGLSVEETLALAPGVVF